MEQHRRKTARGRWAAIVVAVGALLVLVPTASAAALQTHATRDPVPVGSAAPSSSVVTGVSYGPRPEQLLDVYLPSGRRGPFPVIVYGTAEAGSPGPAPTSPSSSSARSAAPASRWPRSTTGW